MTTWTLFPAKTTAESITLPQNERWQTRPPPPANPPHELTGTLPRLAPLGLASDPAACPGLPRRRGAALEEQGVSSRQRRGGGQASARINCRRHRRRWMYFYFSYLFVLLLLISNRFIVVIVVVFIAMPVCALPLVYFLPAHAKPVESIWLV